MEKSQKTSRTTRVEMLPECSFDYETTGTRPYNGDRPFAFCIGRSFIDAEGDIDVTVDVYRFDQSQKTKNRALRILEDFWADTSWTKVIHNAKFEIAFTRTLGIDIPEGTQIHDTYIQSSILRNLAPSHALDMVAWELCGYPREIDKQVADAFNRQPKEQKGYQYIDPELMHTYQVADGVRPLLLHYTFIDELQNDPALWNHYQIEMELVFLTQRMEEYGIRLDIPNIKKLREWLRGKLAQVDHLNDTVFGGINFRSTKQLRELLFDQMKFQPIKLTPTGQPSTDKDTFEKLREQVRTERQKQVFDLILQTRSYRSGLKSLERYEEFADAYGIIHPNINTVGAHATLRESCDTPNLQNVSKEAALTNPFPVPLRRAFRTRKGRVLWFADYSGIEMRLIIAATGERELLRLLQNDPLADMHYPTVECFLGFDEVQRLIKEDPKMFKVHRSAYKNVGFCVAYGGTDARVSMVLGKPIDEILDGAVEYRARFPRIDGFKDSLVNEVEKCGYIKTMFGRKIQVPRDKPYASANYSIQGTAADVLKRAQVRVGHWIEKNYGKWVRMILPIHDEIVFSVDREVMREGKEIRREISQIMVDMPELPVPLATEWKETRSDWAAAKNLDG